jgi:hypothetical protein
MNIIIDLSNIMYNDLWMWNKTKLNYIIPAEPNSLVIFIMFFQQ